MLSFFLCIFCYTIFLHWSYKVFLWCSFIDVFVLFVCLALTNFTFRGPLAFIIRIYHDAQFSECQICYVNLVYLGSFTV